jgi:hypothetical protein
MGMTCGKARTWPLLTSFPLGRIAVLVAFALALGPAKASAQSKDFFLKSMTGVWDGERALRGWREHWFLTVSAQGVVLEIRSPVNAGVVRLNADKVDNEGNVVFSFEAHADERPPNQPYAHLSRPTLTSGVVHIKMVRADHSPAGYLQVGIVFDKRVDGGVRLTQPTVLGDDAHRLFIESFPRAFAYDDWRARGSAGPADSVARLERMFGQLDGLGKWNCLAQQSLTLQPGKTATFKATEPMNRLYVIYSPQAVPGLTYGVASQPPIMGLLRGRTYDYPLVLTNHSTFFASNTTLSFYVRPVAGAPTGPVPLTVFIFGNSMGDYGNGCSLDRAAIRAEATPVEGAIAPPAAPASAAPADPPAAQLTRGGRTRGEPGRGVPSTPAAVDTAAPVAPPAPAPPAAAPPAAAPAAPPADPSPAAVAPSAPPAAYAGPQSGVLTCSGPAVVQHGEMVFDNLPPVALDLSYDTQTWDARLVTRGQTQRLILRNKKPGRQSTCTVRWHVQR